MATPAKDSLSHDPLVNQRVGGRYLIERLIGRGGVGLVYMASDNQDNGRKVVVKVLAPHWAEDADAVARFDREAKRMSKLDHPNVVRMFGHGHHGDATYIVMEYLDGEPLRRYLNRHIKLSFESFIPIASQVLAGVGYVHARETMLRDIKPPNIMLCERDGKANHVKLLDFGLAKLIEEENEITKAHVIGTAGYLAPEQIKGDPIDVRVDVYALGILFFIMLTGESPIVGENDGAILFNHVHGAPKRLRDLLPAGHAVPDSCIDLIHQCLEKDPNDRPQDANEIAEVLFETVHPSLFVLPDASEVTRAPAREYWDERMRRGPNAVAIETEEDSAEHTNPLKKRTLAEVRQAAGVKGEEEITGEHALVSRAAAPPKPGPPQPPANAGRTRPPSPPPPRGRSIPPPPPPPRRTSTGNTRVPLAPSRPIPQRPAPNMNAPGAPPMHGASQSGATLPPTTGGPDASETLTGMPKIVPSDIEAHDEAEAIRSKKTIMGMPRPKPEPGTPELVDTGTKPPPQVVIPPMAGPEPGTPIAAARAGSGRLGPRPRTARAATIGTAVLKASASKRRVESATRADDEFDVDVSVDEGDAGTSGEPDTNRVPQEAAKAMARTPPGVPELAPVEASAPRQRVPPKGLTLPPPGATFGAAVHEPPRGQTIAMDAHEVQRATVAGSGGRTYSGDYKPLGLDLFEEDAAAAAALLATTPIEPPEPASNTRLSVLMLVGGVAALALGVFTAWMWIGGGRSEPKVASADASEESPASEAAPKAPSNAAPDDPPARVDPPVEPDKAIEIVVAAAAGDESGEPETGGAADDDADAAVAMGSLEITAMSGARVTIDGQDSGTVPFTGEISAGSHVVVVSANGYVTSEETVEVAAGELMRFNVSMHRKGSGKKSSSDKPSKPQDPPPPATADDPPPKKDPPKDTKSDVFMNTDTGKPSGGIFLPVGKGK